VPKLGVWVTGQRKFLDRGPGAPLLAVLLGVLMLCWPALRNGGAFFFPDSSNYLRQADAAVSELTGWRTEWSDKQQFYAGPAKADAPTTQQPAVQTAPAAAPLHPVLLGRSIYYGLAIYPAMMLFGSLGAVVLQALLAVATIWLTLIAFGADRSRMAAALLVTTALLAGLTSLPFFVSLLMPDVFAGFAAALAISACFGWRRLSRVERVGLVALLTLSGMAHSSHVLLLSALACVALAVAWRTQINLKAGVAAMLLAAVAGIAGEQAFVFAITHRLGQAPIRPPFLTARLVDDGPGLALLAAKCPAIRLEACKFQDRMPRDSDTFLWSRLPADGVFSVENHAVQRSLAEQDVRFAFATLRYDPLAVFLSSTGKAVTQLGLTRLNIFNSTGQPGSDTAFADNLPPRYAAEVRASRYASGSNAVIISRWANVITALAAAIFLACVAAGRTAERRAINVRAAAGVILMAIAINAAVTGVLSKPHDRYNARIIWVLQLTTLAILAARRRPLAEQDQC
jgi:hypothetical protein